MNEVSVLDHGFVRLDGALADDLSVVNAARVSLAKRSEYEHLPEDLEHGPIFPMKLKDADVGLIKFLISNRHGTPFEHNAFRFHIKSPIFVAREWFRHRIGSFNEWSGRYSKLEPEFYVPEKARTQVGKPGAYHFEDSEELTPLMLGETELAYRTAWDAYTVMLAHGVAKEIARTVLPVGIYTQFYWTVNARSLMNFLSLRTDQTAMFEIRQFANVVEWFFAERMPVTHAAWIANDKVAP